ncbi:DUF3558 domain-containing protein [Nocardia higoensis]|uniref:DUF3558 domain-containing protein n=1 Tax=Nocardia higoensis TaxID=228599 RepID=A0ABS0DHG2_9NOCA|nr:DUF3558 family protein [Nocardia higoensis]MBF6357908.1 DUF3558 domain-containing protein [Nocardia higoensis]
MLGIVVPVLIVTACTADEQNSDTTGSGTTTAALSSVSKTASPTTTAASADPGGAQGDPGGGVDTGQPGGEQPGGTDTCGATPCGVTSDPAPAPGGTDTCGGATECGVAVWDPCRISDADITQLGFRPDSRQMLTDSGGVTDTHCRWQSLTGESEFTISSTRQTLEEVRQSFDYVDFSSLSVGGRSGYQYRAAQDSNHIGCYVGIPVQDGHVAFVTRNLTPTAPEEPCAAARRISEALVGYVP